MEEKKNPKNIYSDLPGIGPFARQNEGKIKFGPPEISEPTWRDIIIDILKGKIFKAAVFILIPILVLFFWLFRYDDFANGCHIKIGLSLLEWNNLEIKRAFKFIRHNSPEDYKKVCDNVETVSPDLPCGGSGGGCFHPDIQKQIVISTLGHKNKPEITAAIIVHETCHSIQREQNRPLNETECYREASRFLMEMGKEEDIPENWKSY